MEKISDKIQNAVSVQIVPIFLMISPKISNKNS